MPWPWRKAELATPDLAHDIEAVDCQSLERFAIVSNTTDSSTIIFKFKMMVTNWPNYWIYS